MGDPAIDQHGHERDPDASRFLAHVEQRCETDGLRLTPIRRQVLKAVAERAGPIRAYELQHALSSSARTLAPMTVYRALNFLVEHGFVHALQTINAFVRAMPDAPVSLYLICRQCGAIAPAGARVVDAAVVDAVEAAGFQSDKMPLEVLGLCGSCRVGPEAAPDC
ncbi:MAG: transcriptional repressor [Lysobacteraceae bacterium]|nr:transcriptional repressor [Xanthomonadales bacterium]HPF75005.1 transcriptional repressor [Xanthomonadaceae bacterium]HRX99027.1 transcriptional repressor [Xanthomonadaceae bacterium]